jgi:subtilisin family serine protease
VETLVERGAVPVRYLPNFAFIVKIPSSAETDLWTIPFVQWAGLYHPAYRIASEFSAGDWSSPGRIVVQSLADDVQALNATLAAAGVTVERVDVSSGEALFTGKADLSAVKRAAMLGEVFWIEPLHEAMITNNQAVWVVQSATSGYTPIHARGLYGQNQIIAMFDTGLDANHPMLSDSEGDPVGPQHRKVVAYCDASGYCPNQPGDFEGHGTHVAGSALGDTLYCSGPSSCYYGTHNGYDGIAVQARIVVQACGWPYWCLPEDPTGIYSTALSFGANIHTNSWGRPPTVGVAKYTWYDSYLDNFVRQILIS